MPILIFILGTIIGSFLSVLTHRIQTKQTGIWTGRSKCPNCHKQLTISELIPLLSYIFLKGKCKNCHQKISLSYPILELITGTTFLLSYLQFKESILLLAGWLIIFTLGIAIAKYDFTTQEIPLKLSIPLGVFALFFSYFILHTPILSIIIGATAGFAFYYAQYFISKGAWTGLGDADLALIIGTLFGPLMLLQSLTTSYVLGSIIGIYLLVFKKSSLKTQLAFGPFLIFGLFINALYGTAIQSIIS